MVWAYANSKKTRQPPSVHSAQPSVCACGHGPNQAELIALDVGDWPREVRLYCQACVPEEHRTLMQQALNLIRPET